jgi:hypothetical protein
VGHPAGHLGQAGGGGEHTLLVGQRGRAEQARRDGVLEVAGDGGVEVAAPDLTVGDA